MTKESGCSSVAIVGAGAAGTLTAAQLAAQAAPRGRPLEIVLIDPAGPTGRRRRLLHHRPAAPAQRLGRPDQRLAGPPGPLPRLAARVPRTRATPIAGRRSRRGCSTARYLRDVLAEALAAADGLVSLERVADRVTGLVPLGRRWRVRVGRDETRYVDAVVLAVGSGAPDDRWAPGRLRRSARFVADPWASGRAGRPGRGRRRRPAGRHRADHGRRRDDPGPARAAPSTRSRGTACCRRRTATSWSRPRPRPSCRTASCRWTP